MNLSNTAAEKIANYLLQINAIKLKPNEPFTWASGWKSPIYCDNRISLSHVDVRNFIKVELANMATLSNAKAKKKKGKKKGKKKKKKKKKGLKLPGFK